MDMFEILEKENATIRNLLGKLLDSTAGRPDERQELFQDVCARLHAEIRTERDHFYPLLRQFPETRDTALQCEMESRDTESLLTEMVEADPNDPQFGRLMERLYSEADGHLTREEQELIPWARQVVPEEQATMLGYQMEEDLRRFRNEFWGH